MTLLTGSTLQGGKYIIVQTLGLGGFGITYEAEQVALHRRVAIKEFFMKEYCDRDSTTSHVTLGTSEGSKELVEKFRMKFIREAQMIAGLDNPHIIKIHDIFEENGTAYYVMPFLDGGSLADKVKENGPLSEQEAIGYIKQIGNALDYLHKQNILHLDVKPSNVLLNSAGEAVLIDFGISKHYDEAGSQTSTTPVGISKGFAPMEQYQQGNMSKFSPATDIYSLGATLYFLLTGQAPPEAAEVNEDGIPEIPHISTATNKAIEQAMSPKRKDRPQSIQEYFGSFERSDTTIIIQESNKTIQQKTESQTKDGHSFVDLGLSVLWSSCNLGAVKELDSGNYFSWGELETKAKFSTNNYSYNKRDFNVSLLKYNADDGLRVLQLSDDVAQNKWGGNWRIPTSRELNELIENCLRQFVRVKNRPGCSLIGPNGNSIFLPCTGYINNRTIVANDRNVCLWSSTIDAENNWFAGAVNINTSIARFVAFSRAFGLPIRPVIKY